MLALKLMHLGCGTGLEDKSLTSACPPVSLRCLLACGSFRPGNAKALSCRHPRNAIKSYLIWDAEKVLKLDCGDGYTTL